MKICIECQSETNRPQREMCVKCYSKWYYQHNKEKVIKKSYEWMHKNPDRFKEIQKGVRDRKRAKQSTEEKRTIWLIRQEKMSNIEKDNRRDRARQYYHDHKDKIKANVKRHRENNPHKIKARKAVWHAMKAGKIPHINTLTCHICNNQAQRYHHHSYEKEHWLDVIPLCNSCHGKVHAGIVSPLLTASIYSP